jgi:hypothetical protein
MIAQNVADIVSRHVKLTVEGIDRMSGFSVSIAVSRCRRRP